MITPPQKPPIPTPAVSVPTAPAKEPHEIEIERKRALLAKIRSTRTSLLSSLAQVEGRNPSKHYAWVNSHQSRITAYQGMGYEICRDPLISTQWKKEDGTHVRGDAILMETSKEMKEMWDYDTELRAIEDLENAQGSFKAFAEREGVPIIESK